MEKKSPFDITKCARPNILALEPYTSERDNYPPHAGLMLLDANENAFGPSIHSGESIPALEHGVTFQSALDPKALMLQRYPDAQSTALRQLFCDYRSLDAARPLKVENVCLSVGSDESIDGLIRAFCTPGKDKILICPPTYGMYQVSADVNDVGVVRVNLDAQRGFTLDLAALNETLSNDPTIKVAFICSPGNPVGNLLDRQDIVQLLQHPTWNGVVVVDEAYIDFVPPHLSFASEVNDWPNLVVTHTMSKAFGLAAIRLGITYSQPDISRLLNNLRGPYNMSSPTVALATAALSPQGIALMEANRAKMVEQRDRMLQELPKIPGFGRFLGGLDTNFILVQFFDKPADQGGVPDNARAMAVARFLATKPLILVRYRGTQPGCEGALRITVGSKEEMDDVLLHIQAALQS